MNHKLVGYLFVCIAFLVAGPGNAQAEGPFPITAEFLESQKGPEGVWPDDPSVPDMPPLPDTADPGLDPNSFLTTHYTNTVYPAKIPNPPAPLNENVHGENPLEVVIYWSMRSPYSYLSMDRLLYLHSNYNVDMRIGFLMPVAVRTKAAPSSDAHKDTKPGGLFGVKYKVPDLMWDTVRQGKYLGVPFKYAVPDPIWQDLYPPHEEGYQYVHPPEQQPYIAWLTRLGCYADLKGKSVEFIHQVSRVIWDGSVAHWPAHVEERFNRIEGLDYDDAIRFIRRNTEEVDQCWLDHQAGMAATGHGGVPLMVFQNEPFFGGDRFDQFLWRLRQSGLTKRAEPIAPIVPRPLRWPAGE